MPCFSNGYHKCAICWILNWIYVNMRGRKNQLAMNVMFGFDPSCMSLQHDLDMKPFSRQLLKVLWCLCKPNHFGQRSSSNNKSVQGLLQLNHARIFWHFVCHFLCKKYLASKLVKHLHEVKLCANYTILLLVWAKIFPRTCNISLAQYWCWPR